jgi:hypothetical protein
MNLFRSSKGKSVERTSLIIKLKLVNKKGDTLDEGDAWQALVDCFKKHPTLDVFQAEISPDKDGTRTN